MIRNAKQNCKYYLTTTVAVVLVLMLMNSAAWGQAFHCIPTCDRDDGRFLSIPGAGLNSLTEQEINIQIAIPGDRSDFELGVFDGDTGLTSLPVNFPGLATDHWDLQTGRLVFDLFADPKGDAMGTILVASLDGQTMPDNDWSAHTIANVDDAQGADGAYRYNLRIRLVNGAGAISNFKLRLLPASVMAIVQNAFGFQSAGFSLDDALTLFPDFPDLSVTTYDGTFRFFSFVETERSEFVVTDGDFDHGSNIGDDRDTDDPDTPNDTLPSWFVPATLFETANTSSPPDDRISSPPLLRTPSVEYSVNTPVETFLNDNPSGSQEWEQFRISTEYPFDRNTMDHRTESLPDGIYTIDIAGLDLQNFAAWHADRIECVTSDGGPCPRIPRYSVGDTVFEDDNGNGVQDSNEAGVTGILMNLHNSNGRLLDQTVTDGQGKYSFAVTNGAYTVAVNERNFIPAGPAGALGDRVWLDIDRDGIQDSGEPGISNVIVKLFAAGADGAPGGGDDQLLSTTVTDVLGLYRFNDLSPGTYFVSVEPGTVPAGLSLLSAPAPVRTIAVAESFLDIDFGYVNAAGAAMIGGQVWIESDGTPASRAPDEAGISDVTVHLCDLASGPCTDLSEFTRFTRTRGATFLFTGLAPGEYRVAVVDLVGKLKGLTLTTSLPTPSPVLSLAADEAVLNIDYGYLGTGLFSVRNSVWLDENRDGIRDAGEVGLAGVTANLVDSMGELIARAVSEPDGRFSFDDLAPGAYRIVVNDLEGTLIDLIPTGEAAIQGLDVAISDADVAGDDFGFNLHGQLATHEATTASPSQDGSVADTDVLTFDFGYRNRCGECQGKVTELVMQYLGTELDAHVVVMQKRPRSVIFDDVVQPGQTIALSGVDKWGTLSTEIYVYVEGRLAARFHTSCSQPIGPGLRIDDFKVVAGSSRRGGALCPIDEICSKEHSSYDDDSSDDKDGHHDGRSDDHRSKDHRSHDDGKSQDHRSKDHKSDDHDSHDGKQCL